MPTETTYRTMTFPSRDEFNLWFHSKFSHEMKARGVKHLFLNTSELNTDLGKTLYYTCDIPSLKLHYTFYIKITKPRIHIVRNLWDEIRKLAKTAMR